MRKLFIILLSLQALIGCDGNTALAPRFITISMLDDGDLELFEKTVLLYEDSKYLISTYFEEYISSYPFDVVYGYENVKQDVIQDTLTQDTLVMKNYVLYKNDDIYTLAHHLEHGTCLIYNKRTKQVMRTIEMESYTDGRPMSTTKGRRFYLGGILFLEAVDLMS